MRGGPGYTSGVNVGRTLLLLGAAIAAVGLVVMLGERLPWLRLGRLPGDLRVERPGFTFYAPLATSILLSVLLSLALWLFRRR